ncbi:transmembrane and immunoglobulin domain-containing protein 1 [Eurytemora carolleeae]|uniref:transmembrane and immunoglobulin domain-containing protein 1 n=1 Tax=Eurytemora carolleeae TaxID=1294199 RepID=UPI000C78A1AA|nr:transmembrane and immunoglobulin domain-containing protein 1 [Eurytemora carolleeae]|eukprot:XP_023322294.1 transmembrane and immunoglobulin domain-containing protein 1-like [Eurytemora affinis]
MEKLTLLVVICWSEGFSAVPSVEVKTLEPQVRDRVEPDYKLEERGWIELLGPGNYSLEEGNELALICRGSSNLNLAWSKIPGLLPNGMTRVRGEQVIVQRVSRDHSGIYRCQDEMDPSLYTDKIVNVLYGPDVLVFKMFIQTLDGINLNLVCQVSSNPLASVLWMKNGQIIQASTQVEYKFVLTHVILHPSKADLGVYTCIANNSRTLKSQDLLITGTHSYRQESSLKKSLSGKS